MSLITLTLYYKLVSTRDDGSYYIDVWRRHDLARAFASRINKVYLLINIFIRFGSKLYRQIIGIPMGTNCAPLIANLFLFCFERGFMLSLSDNNQTDIIEAFNSTPRYLDDLLNIDNPYFEQTVGQIYPTELQLRRPILLIPKLRFWT